MIKPLWRPVGRLDLRLRMMCCAVISPTANSIIGAVRMCALSAQGSKGWFTIAQGSAGSAKVLSPMYKTPLMSAAIEDIYTNCR